MNKKEQELTKEMIGLEKISPSALNTYEECPRLFYYQVWLGIVLDEDKLHMDFGNSIHNAIAEIHRMYDTNFGGGWGGQTFDTIQDFFEHDWTISKVTEESFQKYMQTNKGKNSMFKDRKDLHAHFLADGIAILQSYWNEKEDLMARYGHDLAFFEVPMRIEMRDPAAPGNKLPIPLSLRIDAISRNKELMVDFKTSSGKYDPVETRKKIQGQCYVYADLMETGQLHGRFDYTVLRKGLKSINRVEVVPLTYDMADMVAFYQRVKSILLRIANREFSAPRSGHPAYCQCRKYEDILSVKEIQNASK